MIYGLSSDYRFEKHAFDTILRRADMRSRELEYLKWEWVKVEAGAMLPPDCFLTLDEHECRAFMQAVTDAAWSFGIRPKDQRDDKPVLDALKYHLEDMRKLVFK